MEQHGLNEALKKKLGGNDVEKKITDQQFEKEITFYTRLFISKVVVFVLFLPILAIPLALA